MNLPANVANKRLTLWLNSLGATLTKNAGWGAVSNSAVSSRSPIFGTHFQVPYPVSPAFGTLTKTPGVGGYSSQFGDGLEGDVQSLSEGRTHLRAPPIRLFPHSSPATPST